MYIVIYNISNMQWKSTGNVSKTVAKRNGFKTFEKLVYKVSVMLFKRFPEQNIYKRFQDQSLWFTGIGHKSLK